MMLPKNWYRASLDDLFIFIGGGTPDKGNPMFWNGDTNWASVKDIKSKYLYNTKDKISQAAIETNTVNVANIDDLILVTRISPGEVTICKKETSINQDLKILKILGGLSTLFAYYLIKANKEQIVKKSSGTTVKGIRISDFKSIYVAIPPIDEQIRIVEKIEELYSDLEQSTQSLVTAREQLLVYTKVYLRDIFSGKLTNNWKKNNKQNIPYNSKQKTKISNSIPNHWEYKTLGEITSYIGSGSTPKGGRYTYVSKGIPFIRSQNVYQGFLKIDELAFITEEVNAKMSRTQIKEKDVLLNITGASIGRCAFVPENFGDGNVNQHVCIIRVKSEDISYKYLCYYLNSPEAQARINKINSGATREALTLEQIKKFPIPICSLEEQSFIINEIEYNLTLIDNLEKTIEENLTKTEIYKRVILKKAFEGKLSTNSNNDPNAKEILEKIKFEKIEYANEERLRIKKKIKTIKIMEKDKSIIDLLKESKKPLTSAELWLNSMYRDEIDSFYASLKTHIDKGEIIELPRNGKESLLALNKHNEN